MNIAITDKVFAIANANRKNDYGVYEDRQPLLVAGQYTILHDALSMIELYQRHYEVLQCLRKTSVRSTYKMLSDEKHRLESEINRRIAATK